MALRLYQYAIALSLGAQRVDFAQLVKMYANNPESETGYSPTECTGCKEVPIYGDSDMGRVSTSHVERRKLSTECQAEGTPG
jgi:hypothetical protein